LPLEAVVDPVLVAGGGSVVPGVVGAICAAWRSGVGLLPSGRLLDDGEVQ
jgi:hypothetical protein